MAGQTINDRLLAAKHSLAGQGLAKSVCKATTEEMLGPKKKHLDYLVHCTNEPNVSIPQMANLLMERSQNSSWVVVFKSLITTHHIMCYGNERFTQYLASSNVSFQLSNFVDKGTPNAMGARTGYDMSPFIRRYAKYLNEKALSYRAVAFDFCKVKRSKEEGTLRTMNSENLLKTLPILQNQLDALLEFDCTANDLTNGVINMCFMLLFRDLIRLFACYNDGIINLLEKYFEMNKKQCREALDLYKKFLIRMDRVAEFLKVAENIGIDKGDIPDLTRAPNSLLDALEAHLASLEGNTPTASSNQKNLKSGVTALSNTSNAFGTAAIDESFKQAAVAEEEAALNQFKANLGSPNSASQASTNPFLSDDPPAKNDQILDLFGGVNSTPATTTAASTQPNAIDDLLSLGGNPFADFGAAPAATNGFTAPQQQPAQQQWTANGGFPQTVGGQTQQFGANFNIFGNEPSVFDPLGGPVGAPIPGMPTMTQQQQPQPKPQPQKILTGDLESSLTSLVENLTMDPGNRGSNWSSPKNQPKTSSAGGWQPQPMAATTAATYRPMVGAMGAVQPPMMMGAPGQAMPMMTSTMPMVPPGVTPNMPFGMPQQPQQQMMGSPKMMPPQPQAPPQQPAKEVTFDPFGDL